jgi:peptidoglycan/LPS O-acetylase OafA/YrhL
MVSKATDARLRIAVGLVVIALSFTSLFLSWRPSTEAWLGVMSSLVAVLLLALGVVVLVGRTRGRRLVLTRQRWRYFLPFAAVLLFIIVIVVTNFSLDRALGNPVLAMFPAMTGLLLALLYEPESTAQFKPSDLTDRDVRTWKRISFVLGLIGVVVGSISGVAGVAGNITMLALLLPIAILFLVLAAAIVVMLKSRNRLLKARP